MTQNRLIYITTDDPAEADRLARHAVQSRLAACANIIPGMRSVYWWEGEVQSGEELIVLMKTRADLVEALTREMTGLHSYECPCVVALPLVDGHEPFLSWIGEETRPKAEGSRE
ncbi:MAG: divalent cation tolerance protein CutA [Armatimonadia bacterium]|jgi:periplasmic divalent cation tolerance protein|nr:divalent cation tolerance protein CutA [Armatimonadia bacterium]